MGKHIDMTHRAVEVLMDEYDSHDKKQQEICRNCGWCCRHDVFRVEDVKRDLHLYYVRGYDVVWEPKVRKWFVLVPTPCQFHNGICTIYKRRPMRCADWMCPYPDGSVWEKWEIFRKASRRILQVKYGELDYDTTTDQHTTGQETIPIT